MILEKMVLENFRVFEGTQEIVFSNDPKKNVTIIHAENGFGKTTLLKAMLWGFYGHEGLLGNDGKADDFERPYELIHEGQLAQANDSADLYTAVKIIFNHDEKRYTLERKLSLTQQEQDSRVTKLELKVIKEGQSYTEETPQIEMDTILVKAISRYLFFNGERINYLAQEQNSEQITDAIHQMLGLKLLETTIQDLESTSIIGKWKKEWRDKTSGEKQKLLDDEVKLWIKLEQEKKELENIEANISAFDDEIKTVGEKLENNRDAAKLQGERNDLQKKLEENNEKLEENEKSLKKIIAENGYAIFTKKLIQSGKGIVSSLRKENKIPAPVVNTFLIKLLEDTSCICGRNLSEGTAERQKVEELLDIAGDQNFNVAVGQLDHTIGILEGSRENTKREINRLNRERVLFKDNKDAFLSRISDIHQELGEKKDETVKELENRLEELKSESQIEYQEKGRSGEKIDDLGEKIEENRVKINSVVAKEEQGILAEKRVKAIEKGILTLNQILYAETRDLKPLLNEKISKTFKEIMTKDYWAELNDKYEMRVKKRVSVASDNIKPKEKDVALSTGERTVAALVFISSLLSLAAERSQIKTVVKGLSGSVYPLVIDSPFGSLSAFREGIARKITELAPQVIIFVSPKQYDSDVERALKDSQRIGKQYYLRYNGEKLPDGAHTNLVINDQQLKQYAKIDKGEFTEIVELGI